MELEWEVDDGAGVCQPRGPIELVGEFSVLSDLSEWVPPYRLKDWIEQEIEKLSWDIPHIAESSCEYLDDQPRMLLALLSFAYATRVFCLDEIVGRCYSDGMFRLICEGNVPFVHELSNFRRRNRNLLEQVLAGLFLQAIQDRFDLDAVWLSTELAQDLNDHAKERLDIARHMDAA